MRFVAACRVVIRPMNDFLKHQMPPWILGEIGRRQQPAEVLQIAVQIAADEHFGHAFQRHEPAATTGCIAEMLNGAAKRSKNALGVRHDTNQEEVTTNHTNNTNKNQKEKIGKEQSAFFFLHLLFCLLFSCYLSYFFRFYVKK